MKLNTEHLAKCLATLEASLSILNATSSDKAEYEIFRNATVKGFELTMEIGVKLLRKALKEYIGRPREIDALTFRDTLRHAAKHSLMTAAEVERWFKYRDNRNNTAHDYGIGFAEETLVLLPDFIKDARALEASLNERFGRADD